MDARKHHNEAAKCLYDRQSTCGIESSGGVCVVAYGFENLQEDPGMNVTKIQQSFVTRKPHPSRMVWKYGTESLDEPKRERIQFSRTSVRGILPNLKRNTSLALQDRIEFPSKNRRRTWQTGNGQRQPLHAHESNLFHAGCSRIHALEPVLVASTNKASNYVTTCTSDLCARHKGRENERSGDLAHGTDMGDVRSSGSGLKHR